jgi:hypothetical protein
MFHDGKTILPGFDESQRMVMLAIGAAAAELAPPVDEEVFPTSSVSLDDVEKFIRAGELFVVAIGGRETLLHVRTLEPGRRLVLNTDLLEIDADTLLNRAQVILQEGILD